MGTTIAIVDGYSTGAQLAPKFTKNGASCLHIQSSDAVPRVYAGTFDPSQYAKNFVFSDYGDASTLYARLVDYGVDYILPGADSGAELAGQLNLLSGAEGDAVAVAARKDKYLMIEAIKAAGLDAPCGIKSDNLREVIDWIERNPNWPFIAKPLSSAGNDGVQRCHNLEEVERAFSSIVGRTTFAGPINHYLLLEEFLQGDEYIVNTVGRDRHHYITDIWRSKWIWDNNNTVPIRDTIELIPFDYDAHTALRDYASAVVELWTSVLGPRTTKS